MSGVTGADRIKSRADYEEFVKGVTELIHTIPEYRKLQPSGSYISDISKQDFGDIDLIVFFETNLDKIYIKKQLIELFQSTSSKVIVPFTSEKHQGKRYYNSGEIITVRYHNSHTQYSAQIDNIISLDEAEFDFKQQFLNMPAEKQGLILGLVKIAVVEQGIDTLVSKLHISNLDVLKSDQEYEFNLSSNELQLRKVTYQPNTVIQIAKDVIWKSQNWQDVLAILQEYDLNASFDKLLKQSKNSIANKRSQLRLQGIFASMITVKSGEVGTTKGNNKIAALSKIKEIFAL